MSAPTTQRSRHCAITALRACVCLVKWRKRRRVPGEEFPSWFTLHHNATPSSRRIKLNTPFLFVPFVLAIALSGCESIHYYSQAVSGHFDLLSRRVSIDAAISDESTSATHRQALTAARDARRFASEVLELPENKSYTQYAPLDRDAVTYNVVATPEFSLEPKQWCFPVAGCVNYRGYFKRSDAEKKADELRQSGHDVVITRAAAYSTLGWFADPLPGPVLEWPTERVAGLIFHELAHQKLYLPNHTTFNESYASAVALLGLRIWRKDLGDNARQRFDERQAAYAIIEPTLAALKALYDSDISTAQKRAEKSRIFAAAQQRYSDQSSKLPHWENWFAGLNNARLVSLSDYTAGIASFESLFSECHEQWRCFHERSKSLAEHLPAAWPAPESNESLKP